jgi:hypothetical protein
MIWFEEVFEKILEKADTGGELDVRVTPAANFKLRWSSEINLMPYEMCCNMFPCHNFLLFLCIAPRLRHPFSLTMPPKDATNWTINQELGQKLQAKAPSRVKRTLTEKQVFQTFLMPSMQVGGQRAQNINVITESISLAGLPTVFHRPIPPIRQFGAHSALIIDTVFIIAFNFNWFRLYFAVACDHFCDGCIDRSKQKVRLSLISVDRGLLQHIS